MFHSCITLTFGSRGHHVTPGSCFVQQVQVVWRGFGLAVAAFLRSALGSDIVLA